MGVGGDEISVSLKLWRVSALLLLPTGEVGKGKQFFGAVEFHGSLFLLLQPKALAELAFFPSIQLQVVQGFALCAEKET